MGPYYGRGRGIGFRRVQVITSGVEGQQADERQTLLSMLSTVSARQMAAADKGYNGAWLEQRRPPPMKLAIITNSSGSHDTEKPADRVLKKFRTYSAGVSPPMPRLRTIGGASGT